MKQPFSLFPGGCVVQLDIVIDPAANKKKRRVLSSYGFLFLFLQFQDALQIYRPAGVINTIRPSASEPFSTSI